MINFKYILTLALSITAISCSGGQNFSQFPGFVEHFKKYPPRHTVPTTDEIELLGQYKPQIYLAKGQRQMIDFYADYIAHGELIVDGRKVATRVSQALLNEHRDNPKALFKFKGDYKTPGTSKVYARVDYDQIDRNGVTSRFTFLSYNLVFPVSGILQGLGTIQSIALAVGGNLDDWHQLDHYVGLSVALLDGKAVAMTLQQHNYHTTYLLDSHDGTPGIAIDIAKRSNEIYPHSQEPLEHPAVSFLKADNLEFVTTGRNKPMMAGYDITHGEQEVDYQLEFLPQTDAFYQFKGSLGKNRLLPGRGGPPGADYATLPGLMPRLIRLVTGYRPGPTTDDIRLLDDLFDSENFSVNPDAIKPYTDRFFDAL